MDIGNFRYDMGWSTRIQSSLEGGRVEDIMYLAPSQNTKSVDALVQPPITPN